MQPELKIYRSSAGSGKTYTLVSEYLRILLSDPSPGSYRYILAMTFTNKAAGEMKSRVIKALYTLSRKATDKSYDERYLESIASRTELDPSTVQQRSLETLHHMIHHYSDLSISTIDKFLHKVIRAFSRELGVPSDFQVQIDRDEVLQEAVDELLENAGLDPELTRALKGFVHYRVAENKDYRLDRDLLDFGKTLLQEDAGMHKATLEKIEIDQVLEVRAEFDKKRKAFENTMRELGAQGQELLRLKNLEVDDFTRKGSGVGAFFQKLMNPQDGDYTKVFSNSYVKQAVEEDKWYTANAPSSTVEKIETIKDDFKTLHEQAESTYQKHYQEYKVSLELSKRIYSLAVAKELLQAIDNIREREGILLISDFNEQIGEVIRTEPIPFIYERAGTRYHHFLLDEFQDTSALQWQNIAPLVADSLAKGKSNLIVGDGKQAIYRWRNGDVEQFLNLPEIPNANLFPSLVDHQSILLRHNLPLSLDSNYRSKKEVVHFNNWFFDALINKEEARIEEAYRNIEQEVSQEGTGLVEARIMPKETEVEQIHQQVLATISDCHNRNIPYRNIAILTRRKEEGSDIARFLLKRDIPVVSQESLLIIHDPGVRLLESTLQWITEPENNHYKAKVIHWYCNVHKLEEASAMAKVTSYTERDGRKYVSIDLEKFFQSKNIEIKVDELSSRPLIEMITRMARAYQLSESHNPFLQQFLEQVNLLAGSISPSLLEFLEKWELQREKVSVQLPEGLDAVQVLTIHKSKGLQFPVVLVPHADWAIRSSQEYEWVPQDNDKLPIALIKTSMSGLKGTPFEEIAVQENEKSILDNFNLLYVAFTRAENELYVTITEGKHGKRITSYTTSVLKESEDYDSEKGILTKGERVQYPDSEKPMTGNTIASFTPSPLPKISFTGNSGESDALSFGKIAHRVLGGSKNIVDLKAAIEREIEAQPVVISDRLRNELIPLLESEEFMELFNLEGETLSEREFIVDGALYRPDRIVLKDQSAFIIDFKTGDPSRKDVQQIEGYANALAQMGYAVRKKCLIYTANAEVHYV